MALKKTKPWPRPLPLDGAWPALPRFGGWRAIGRAVVLLLWTCLCVPIQAVLIRLPGRAKAEFTRVYWSGICWLLGLRIRVIGKPAIGKLPVVFVSNHSSWLDVAALGAKLPTSFIAKEQIGRWPGFSIVARLGRTLYVSRRAAGAARENKEIQARIAAGDNIVLFPEGTTSDGTRVLPFRSAFLAIAETDQPHVLQPVSIVYDQLGYLPARREERSLFAWFGDMDMMSHYSRLARERGLRVTIMFHPPLDATTRPNRKRLALDIWRQVSEGAAQLRRSAL